MSASTSTTPGASISITVGAGGAGSTNNSFPGSNGGDSAFGTTVAKGGGGGGTVNQDNASAGGSGGGAGGSSGTVKTPAAGTAGQGNDGGSNGYVADPYPAGGGGGAGAVGSAGAGSQSGSGGAGLAYSISGSSITYAGGGGDGGSGIVIISYTPPFDGITFTGNVRFLGNLLITGALSKSSGTFVIDHPQNPGTHLLYHSFVESPEAKNIYDGIATLDENGEARIFLPEYFQALNGEFRYQWLAMYQPMPGLYIKEEVHDNQFVIAGGPPGGQVSWQVTGVRHDPYIQHNPIEVEVDKGPGQPMGRGECLYGPLCE